VKQADLARLTSEVEASWAEYDRLRRLGMRQQSRQALDRFTSLAVQLPQSQRRSWTRRILAPALTSRDRAIPFLRPLEDQFLAATLEEWRRAEPANAAPWRYSALLSGPWYEPLRKAIALEPEHLPTVRFFITRALEGIDYATHELPHGLLGDRAEILEDLDGLEALLVCPLDAEFGQRIQGYRQQILAAPDALRGD
jgi:hypothetical protein